MSVVRNSAVAGAGAPRRTYITMRVYNDDFFSYTTSLNSDLQTIGRLAPVTGATAGNCAKGAFLRETGKRLYSGVNPGISTLMVGVYDFATGLSGFIDPNSFAFSPQNTDRAYYIDSAGYNPNSNDSLRSDQGPPVFTHGDVKADGNLYIGGSASTIGAARFNNDVRIDGTTTFYGTLWATTASANFGSIVMNGKLYQAAGTITQDGTNDLTLPWESHNVINITINSNDNFTINAMDYDTPYNFTYVIFNNTGNFTPTIYFGANIRAAYNGTAEASLTLIGNISVTMSFIYFNKKLLEVSRMNVSNA
jgi:hypothetical protein